MHNAAAAGETHSAASRIDGATAFISGALDFASVLHIDSQIRAWLADTAAKALVIDFSGVTYANSAAIAVSLGWMRHARAHGIYLHWQHLPRDMHAMASVGGVAELFDAV